MPVKRYTSEVRNCIKPVETNLVCHRMKPVAYRVSIRLILLLFLVTLSVSAVMGVRINSLTIQLIQ